MCAPCFFGSRNMQLDLFKTEEEVRQDEIALIKGQVNNLRRGIFGRYDAMCHELTQIQASLSEIKNFLNMEEKTKGKAEIVDFPLGF